MTAAIGAAAAAWQGGFRYAKAGLVLTELMPIETVQKSLLVGFDREKRAALMGALDSLNRRYGRGTLYTAAAGVKRDWQTKFERKSPGTRPNGGNCRPCRVEHYLIP